MAHDSFLKAQQKIKEHFKHSTKRVYKQSYLRKLLLEKSLEWSLGSDPSFRLFIDFLLEETEMTRVQLRFPRRLETRYCWQNCSEFELALSLRAGSYLTHQSAAYFHGLISGPLNNLYVNFEQKKREQKGELTQEAVDIAFRNRARITKNKAQYNGKTIWLLNGMFTGRYGVIEMIGEKNEAITVTNLARTLVDIAVRPAYAGGVAEVFGAYRRAKGRVTVEELSKTIVDTRHIYPYHQAVGFYLEKAGVFDKKTLDPLRSIPMQFDFYLAHQMGETDYSKEWQIYYPKDFPG